MSDNVFQKGNFIYSKDKIFEQFKDFLNLYKERPIKNNKGGMGFNNMFFFFLVLTKKKPFTFIQMKMHQIFVYYRSTLRIWIIGITLFLKKRMFLE